MGIPLSYKTKPAGVPLAEAVQNLPPSGIREFFDIVASRPDCISLGVGEPDFVTPEPILQAAVEAIRQGFTHYTGNQGLPALRQAIADYLKQEYGLSYDPHKEILITVGVSQGLDLALRSLLNPGEKVLYLTPSYVSYRPMTILAGGVPIEVRASAENHFLPPLPSLEKYGASLKAFLLNYPCNPTGASMDREYLENLAWLGKKHNWFFISDEIYAELTYDQEHTPLASLPGMKERTLLLGGFSKAFAMTGWRIGYACGPASWVRGLFKIHQYSMLCAPTLSQAAALAALQGAQEDKKAMKEEYRKRRNFIVHELKKAGLICPMPQGAFYVFPKITPTIFNSMEFAKKLLEEENVAVVPGNAFGEAGEGHIRCSYATSFSDLEKAVQRIHRFVQKYRA